MQGDRITCTSCGNSYPILADGIPVLIDNAEDHCATAVAEMLAEIQYVDSVLLQQESRLATGCKRPQALGKLLDAMRARSVVVNRLLQLLPPRWPIEQLMKSRPTGLSTRMILQYLVRDWSGRARAEAVISDVMAALRRQLGSACGRETALVLGAGTGRYAWELSAEFANVLALDWSISSALSYTLLTQGPLDLHEVNEQNVATVEDIAVPARCEIPPRAGQPDRQRLSRLRWLIADGRKTPLAAGSCSALFSVYFSDLLLADALVNEAWRLLRPGGAFVHLGVLGYEHGNFDEMLTAEELCARFVARGFHVTPCEWVPHFFWSSQRLVQVHMNAFAFSAVKPAGS
jgi:SAM-dependent methyltransferase